MQKWLQIIIRNQTFALAPCIWIALIRSLESAGSPQIHKNPRAYRRDHTFLSANKLWYVVHIDHIESSGETLKAFRTMRSSAASRRASKIWASRSSNKTRIEMHFVYPRNTPPTSPLSVDASPKPFAWSEKPGHLGLALESLRWKS